MSIKQIQVAAVSQLLLILKGLNLKGLRAKGKDAFVSLDTPEHVTNKLVETYKQQQQFKTVTKDADGYEIGVRSGLRIRVDENGKGSLIVELHP